MKGVEGSLPRSGLQIWISSELEPMGDETVNTRWWPPTLLDSGLCVLRDVETTGRHSNASARSTRLKTRWAMP